MREDGLGAAYRNMDRLYYDARCKISFGLSVIIIVGDRYLFSLDADIQNIHVRLRRVRPLKRLTVHDAVAEVSGVNWERIKVVTRDNTRL